MNRRCEELYAISCQLEEIARAEACNLWRIAREAEKRCCAYPFQHPAGRGMGCMASAQQPTPAY